MFACHLADTKLQKISVERIHQQYEQKREDSAPWMLKHQGHPADLETTMGLLNTFQDNLVVFQAMNVSTASNPIATPKRSVKFENPLSPKDANSRIRTATPISSKPTLTSNDDENANARPYPASHNTLLQPEPSANIHQDPSPVGQRRHQSPFPNASPNTHRGDAPLPLQNSQQFATFMPKPLDVPHVKVDEGHFPRFYDAWIERYKAAFPGESQGR